MRLKEKKKGFIPQVLDVLMGYSIEYMLECRAQYPKNWEKILKKRAIKIVQKAQRRRREIRKLLQH